MQLTYTSYNSSETKQLARILAGYLDKGSVLALTGDLGSGKTTFIKGLAAGLRVKDARYVSSPTFTLINEYKGSVPLYHFDVYRLESENEFEELGYEEYFYGQGITAIEWAEKIKDTLPESYLEIIFKAHALKGNYREIAIIAHGQAYYKIVKKLKSISQSRKGIL